MIWSFAAATILALALTLIVGLSWLRIFLLILTVILAGMTVWTILMYRVFSYNGKRQMSRQIIAGAQNTPPSVKSFARITPWSKAFQKGLFSPKGMP